MKNKKYWENRVVETNRRRYDITFGEMQKETRRIYNSATKKIVGEVNKLYVKLLEESVNRSEIWSYKHYRDLQKAINEQMVRLGEKEVNILNEYLEEALTKIYEELPVPYDAPVNTTFALIDEARVKQLIARKWTGKHFTSTVWDNKEKLAIILKQGITDAIVLGKSNKKIIEEVMKKMNVGYNSAELVVRTELQHTVIEGTRQRFKDSGYKQVEWLTAEDEKVCDICRPLDGKLFDVDSTELPPAHPRCRCDILAVLD